MKTFLSLSAIALSAILLTFLFGCYFNFFYPVKYSSEIIACSSDSVAPELIASIINVESGYNKDAVSPKGAVGLMQIMPQTAEWVCSKKGIDYSEIDLKDEQTNISIGSHYLQMLFEQFSDFDTAICAYNAGPTKVKSWLAEQNSDKLLSIPFNETRQYLLKVKKNLKYYSKKYKKT